MSFKSVVHTNKGFTLIELLIAVSISIFIFTIIFSLFREGLVSYDRTVSQAEAQLNLRHIHNLIKRDIVSSKIGTIDGTSYPMSVTNKLTLLEESSVNYKFVIYSVEEDALYRSEELNKIEEDETVVLNKDLLIEDISAVFGIDETDSLIKVTLFRKIITDYSSQIVDKEIEVQAKPRGIIER